MRYVLIMATILLSGCAAYKPLLPEDYTDDVAIINDTFQRISSGEANLYFVKTIDGQPIPNALSNTIHETSGKGMRLFAVGAARKVPVKPLKVHIVAQNYYAAPVQSMFGDNVLIEGDVDLTPVANSKYLIKGELKKDYSAVWIEDINGQIVSSIIEDPGSSAQGVNDNKKTALASESNDKVLSREEQFLRLSTGEREDFVIEKIGKPDRITENKRNLFVNRPDYTIYHYAQLGDVQFIGQISDNMFVDKITVSVKGSPLSIETAKKQLESNDGVLLRSVAQEYYRKAQVDSAVLDLFADRLWEGKSTEDDYMVDAMAWFCKLLGKSGNARYAELLGLVSKEAQSRKLRHYAAESLKLLSEDSAVEQFKPTSI